MRAGVMLYAQNDKLNVVVMNPVEITNREKTNVQYKLECARKYDDITEYFSENVNNQEILDEGAGLGIIIISMMLRNLGVTEEDLVIRSKNNRTAESIKIPLR